ncbi:MAG: hypothetical protein U9O94_07815 [Nanoarchaeota archaeon]|nr:hypothetical protein [Nanoarchaeota archaeon]
MPKKDKNKPKKSRNPLNELINDYFPNAKTITAKDLKALSEKEEERDKTKKSGIQRDKKG